MNYLEEELFNKIIRPSITENTIHFDILLQNLKEFYETKSRMAFPNNADWDRLISEIK